jgi:hypothetical protein
MEVDYALLAAFADLASDGKVSIFHGGLETIHLPQLGRIVTPIYFAFRVSFRAEECGGNGIVRVELVDPYGTPVDSSEETVLLQVPPPDGHTKISFVCRFAGIVLQVAGNYLVRLLFNGEEKKVLPLTVTTAAGLTEPEESK